MGILVSINTPASTGGPSGRLLRVFTPKIQNVKMISHSSISGMHIVTLFIHKTLHRFIQEIHPRLLFILINFRDTERNLKIPKKIYQTTGLSRTDSLTSLERIQ